MFKNEIDSTVHFLTDIEDSAIQQQGTDTWVWSRDPAGHYPTRTAYNLLGEEATVGRQEDCFDKLWKIKIPARKWQQNTSF